MPGSSVECTPFGPGWRAVPSSAPVAGEAPERGHLQLTAVAEPDGDRILATVSAAKEEEEVEDEELGEGPAEPEVIGRPGEDGEGSEGS